MQRPFDPSLAAGIESTAAAVQKHAQDWQAEFDRREVPYEKYCLAIEQALAEGHAQLLQGLEDLSPGLELVPEHVDQDIMAAQKRVAGLLKVSAAAMLALAELPREVLDGFVTRVTEIGRSDH